MRYIGGKSLLLDCIDEVIKENIGEVSSIIDVFAGSTVVSNHLKEKGIRVISNDFLYFSYVIAKGTLGINRKPSFGKLGIRNPIKYLNELTIEDTDIELDECFVYKNYSPNDDCERMYFQNDNAIKIDIIRKTIEDWKDAELIDTNGYYYLLAALLNAVPYVANITGVYSAYLKFWDTRTYNQLELLKPDILSNGRRNKCYNCDYREILQKKCDLMYADPPYNSREYLPNYHILETIAKYDNPDIYGVTGMRKYEDQKSDFCKKDTVYIAFEDLIKNCKSKYLLISYNNEGLMDTSSLVKLCEKYAKNDSFRLYEYDYRRYKNKIPNEEEGLKEQLYFLRRH